jgi:hypothetical protein
LPAYCAHAICEGRLAEEDDVPLGSRHVRTGAEHALPSRLVDCGRRRFLCPRARASNEDGHDDQADRDATRSP